MKHYTEEIEEFLKINLQKKFPHEGSSIDKLIEFIVDNELINTSKIRNTMLIADNDLMRRHNNSLPKEQQRKVIDIYNDFAYKYDINVPRVKEIIRHRKTHEISFKL